MDDQCIQWERRDNVGWLTMNRPEKLNAMDTAMAGALADGLAACEADAAVHVVVVAGRGKAFCAGGDLASLYEQLRQGRDAMDDGLARAVGHLALAIKRLDKLVLTCVQGAAAGAGANLALGGDFVLAASNARFIQAFAGVGLVPDTGGAFLLSRSIGCQRALELCITGRPLPAEEAKTLGLVYRTCPPESLEAETQAFARQLAAGPLLAYRNIKRQVYAACFAGYEAYLRGVEGPGLAECAASPDYREGVRAFVEKRHPRFGGGL